MLKNREGVAGIAITLRFGRSGVPIPVEGTDFSLLQNGPDRRWGPHSFMFNRYRSSFSVIKRPGLEVNYSPPSSAEFKNEWGSTRDASIVWTQTTYLHMLYHQKGLSHFKNRSVVGRFSELNAAENRTWHRRVTGVKSTRVWHTAGRTVRV